jgi:beta-mannosidase
VLAPSWNQDLRDRSLARTLRGADPTRPVLPHSGVPPGLLRGGTDTHLYFGWYAGEARDLAGALRRWPRLGRFVSEFGAQAVPTSAAFMEPERWPRLDWARLLARHNLQRWIFDRRLSPDEFATFEDWRDATQAYQAALIQLQAEDLRRVKYRPTGGFVHFSFADGHPGVTWSVLDHERRPTAGLAALRDACRDVLPMLDPRTGAVHVASERRRSLAGARLDVTAGGRSWAFEGDVPPDGVVFVGRVDLPPGLEQAQVVLSHPDIGEVGNTYGGVVLRLGRPEGGTAP